MHTSTLFSTVLFNLWHLFVKCMSMGVVQCGHRLIILCMVSIHHAMFCLSSPVLVLVLSSACSKMLQISVRQSLCAQISAFTSMLCVQGSADPKLRMLSPTHSRYVQFPLSQLLCNLYAMVFLSNLINFDFDICSRPWLKLLASAW